MMEAVHAIGSILVIIGILIGGGGAFVMLGTSSRRGDLVTSIGGLVTIIGGIVCVIAIRGGSQDAYDGRYCGMPAIGLCTDLRRQANGAEASGTGAEPIKSPLDVPLPFYDNTTA